MPLSLHLYFMRIGILTLPLHTNYGGILQAYALQTMLERMGHEVVVIDKPYGWILPLWKRPFIYTKRAIKKYILRQKEIVLLEEKKRQKEFPIVSQHTQQFIEKYIHRKVVNSPEELQERNFDAIVVGSDQIWRPKYYRSIENAYLAFAEEWNIKRIAYAASFGTDDWEYTPEQTKKCGELLKKFDAVSVREASGVQLCKEHFGVESQHVLDPTMLLDKEDYIRLIETAGTPKSKGTLLNYILDETPEKHALIEKVAKDKGLVPFRVNSKVEDRTTPLEDRIQPPVENWIRGFYDAEFVVTDSFHACVFSILFGKPFVVVGNKERGMARFESLLRTFGLGNRLVNCMEDYNRVKDMKVASHRLQENRILSYEYLSKYLA